MELCVAAVHPQSLNIQVMDDISDMLSRISATLTAESLHELVVSKARIDSIAKPNLGMLCRPLPRVGALRVNGETLDSILGRRCLTVQAIELCGMPPEGALSVSERCRLYSALWISIARGSWGMARGKVERNLRIFVAAAQERTLAIAWSRLPAGSRLALDMAAEREAVGSRLVHGASDEDVDSLRHGGWFTSMAGLVHEEDRRGLAGSLGVAVTFALFADAMEALVHKHEDKHTPGGTILWRLYCVARVLEGFPAGPPFAASARSGFRTSRPFSEVESTTALDASLHQLRQAREAAEGAQLACGLGSSAVPSTDDAHSIRKDMQSGRGTDLSRAGLRSLWEALPRFERLRSTEVSPLSGEAVPRHVLSFGECFVLAPFEDEEDVATLPLVQLAAQVAGMARPARPRRLPFAVALRVAMLDDPCGDAALARWAFMLLADAPAHTPPCPLQHRRAELRLGGRGADSSPRAGADSPGLEALPLTALEVGGAAALAAARAAWYRVNLEAAVSWQSTRALKTLPQLMHDRLSVVAEGECAPWSRSCVGAAAAGAASASSIKGVGACSAGPAEAAGASTLDDAQPESATPPGVASWSDAISTWLPVLAHDVFPMALAMAFPPTPDRRLDVDLPLGESRRDVGPSRVSRPPRWAKPTGTDLEEIWHAATRVDFAAKPLPMPLDETAVCRTLGWDPAQPFSPAARWKALGSILESPPGEPPAHVKWPNPGRASGAGARGRMSVMRWCLESSCLVPGALGQGRRVAAASGLIRSGLDPVVYSFDVWATILARATFEKVLGHLAAAVARGLRPPSRSSPLGAEAAARDDPGRDSTAARVAAATRWAQELVELASGLGGVPAAAWDVDARSRLNERDVADWAAGLFGLRGRVGWDGLLAAALWNRSEAPLPRNAGALVDMEPHAGDPRGACDETSCATPARTMALLTVLSQLRPAADGSFTPRGWAVAAKAAYSRAWELFQAMTHAIRSKPSATENDAMWASALARALWEARREAPAARLDVTSFLATAAAAVEGGDTQPGHPGVVALLARTLHLSGGTLRDAIAVMRDVAGP